MSDYQKIKQRALAVQQDKEEELKAELARKAEREKQAAKDEEERRKRLDLQAKEARRKELMTANAKLVAAQSPLLGSINAAAISIEYNPFAEDERTPISTLALAGSSFKSSKSQSKTASHSAKPRSANGHGRASSGRPAGSASTGGNKRDKTRDKESPPPLGRKEKAARAFLQKAKKSTATDSLFSVRYLVAGADGKVRPGTGSGLASPIPPRPGVRSPLPSGSAGSGHTVKKPVKSGKDEGTGGIAELRKLCPDREVRDRRTIDEIHRDIKTKKGDVPLRDSSSPDERDRGRQRINGTGDRNDSGKGPGSGIGGIGKCPRSESTAKASISKPKQPPIPSSARPISRLPPPASTRPLPSTHITRHRSLSSSSTESSSTTGRPRKQFRSDTKPGHRFSRSPSIDPNDISAAIRGLFRRPGRIETSRWREDASDEESDMEAGLSDVEKEERMAARIARIEDEQAEREEEARRKAKEKARREREREREKGKAG